MRGVGNGAVIPSESEAAGEERIPEYGRVVAGVSSGDQLFQFRFRFVRGACHRQSHHEECSAKGMRARGSRDDVAAPLNPLVEVAGPFDLVVANIGGGVLGSLAPELVDRVRLDGGLVLSGLLETQLDAVVAACPGCVEVERLAEGGWAAAWLRRVGPA